MKKSEEPFTWTRFLVAFIAAPLLFTLLTFWAVIPLYALLFGGPFYVVAGVPLAAWYLRRYPPDPVPILLLAQAAQLLQIPFYGVAALVTFNYEWLALLPTFLIFGAVFALLWSSIFFILYHLLAAKSATTDEKETPYVRP